MKLAVPDAGPPTGGTGAVPDTVTQPTPLPSPPRRIALFGGTFDPVHLGHVEIASLAREQLSLDQVRFLPCRLSPHKRHVRSAPPEHRLRMLELALAGLPWAVADDFELHHPPPSYSWRTAEEMRRRFPDARLYWLMGSDQWRDLPDWNRPDHLAGLVEFIVATRDGQAPAARPGWVCHPLASGHPASATTIRAAAASGSPPPWLHPAVLDHITRHRLYLE